MNREGFENRDAYANGSVYVEEILKQLDERNETLTSETFRAQVESERKGSAARSRIEEIKTDLEALNRAVQDTSFLSVEFGNRFGVDFKNNREDALAWIEHRVAELEQSLRTPTPERTESLEQTEPEPPQPQQGGAGEGLTNTVEKQSPTTDAPGGAGSTEPSTNPISLETPPVPPTPPEAPRRSRSEIEAEIAYLRGVNASSSYNSEEFQNRYPDFRDRFHGENRDAIAYNWIQNRLRTLRSERQARLAEEQTESGIVNPESIGPEAGNALREAYRNTERGSVSGWLLERLKGTATIGYWEVRQAERFRSNTDAVGEDVEAQSRVLEQTRDLDVEVARAEAEQVWDMVRRQGGENGITRDDIENASRQIDVEKRQYNARVADRIVSDARRSVEEQLARYRNEYGQSILTPERLAQLETGIRQRLFDATTGMGGRFPEQIKERVNFVREVRERMDPRYWRRYVYGGVEAALMFFGLKYAVPKLLDLLPSAFQTTPGTIAPSPDKFIPMDRTIWHTAQEVLTQHGYSNPTNEQIMKVAKQVALDNNISVAEWGISGNPMDTKMLQGHMLNFRGALSLIAKGLI